MHPTREFSNWRSVNQLREYNYSTVTIYSIVTMTLSTNPLSERGVDAVSLEDAVCNKQILCHVFRGTFPVVHMVLSSSNASNIVVLE